jgi:hypothetical protein
VPPREEKPKKLLNQFNFCERASQTNNNPLREHSAQTQPPPRGSYRDYCNGWIINDAYEIDAETRPAAGTKGHGAGAGGDEEDYGTKGEGEEGTAAPAGEESADKDHKTPAKETKRDKEKEGK